MGTATVHLHGVVGRTIDLVDSSPEVVGSEIESFVCHLLGVYKVPVVGCLPCHSTWSVTRRGGIFCRARWDSAVVSWRCSFFSPPQCFLLSSPRFFSPLGKIFICLMASTLTQRINIIYIAVTGTPLCGPCTCYGVFFTHSLHVWIFHTFHPSPLRAINF